MKRLMLNPLQIWSYYPFKVMNPSLIEEVRLNGWGNIPPIPVFATPEINGQEPEPQHRFILMDGNHRRNAAVHMQTEVPAAVYAFGEEVKVKEHGLAPFRHANHPRLYETLLKAYILRDSSLIAI